TTLTTLAQEALPDSDNAFIPLMRRDHPEPRTTLEAAAKLHTLGTPVHWPTLIPDAHPTPLPTYAFQRTRYWLEDSEAPADLAGVGLGAAGHPMLGALVELADGKGVLFTATLSERTHPWLAEHGVRGRTVVPGVAYVELALRAGEQVGCERVEEITHLAPLVLPREGGVRLQVRVGAADEAGRRSLTVHSRPEDTPEGDWVHHATGVLGTGASARSDDFDLRAWPPAGAEKVDISGFYQRATDTGFAYGPLFAGLKALWRRGDEVFAEVTLPDEAKAAAERFALHPGLFDAVLQAMAAGSVLERLGDGEEAEHGRLPFAWTGVELYASGASSVRARLTPARTGGVAFAVADASGAPVASVASLVMRPVSPEAIAGAAPEGRDALYRVDLTELRLPEPPATDGWAVLGERPLFGCEARPDLAAFTGELPGTVLASWEPEPDVGTTPASVHAATARALGLLQRWAADPRAAGSRLVFVTRYAAGHDVRDLTHAPLWGLVRSALAERAGRVVLVDLDGTEESARALPAALETGETEIVVRRGTAYAPRLVKADGGTRPGPETGTASATATVFRSDGTVLVTGATGALGQQVARHLVAAHGVRGLLLVSRGGPDAPGAAALLADLRERGAQVTLAACDVSDRAALAALLAEHPVTAVVHTAGALDDGVLDALTPERLATVLRPKADGALHLSELTDGQRLDAFVLFSSVAGVLGAPGQASYAAANTFLDALARSRRTRGLPGTTLAWGPWLPAGSGPRGMAGRLGRAEQGRMARGGIVPLPAETQLALLDAALRADEPVSVPVRLNPSAFSDGEVPAVLHSLVRATARRTSADGGSPHEARRIAGLTGEHRARALLDLVRTEVAGVLGHASLEAVQPRRAFKDAGFDSLTAVELRTRLHDATGLRLPATLVFDHPTPEALAAYLDGELPTEGGARPEPVLAELERLEALLTRQLADGHQVGQVTPRLRALLDRITEQEEATASLAGDTSDLDAATDDELFALVDSME
ncbi:type I polyketide synthase, partial [Streptomyces albidoflavus]